METGCFNSCLDRSRRREDERPGTVPASGPDRPLRGAVSLCASGAYRNTRIRPRRETTTLRRALPRLRSSVALERPSVSPSGEKVN